MNGLQIFLLINMVMLGIAATVAIQHAYAHYMHKKHPEKDHDSLKDSPLSKEFKDQLIKRAEQNFQDRLEASGDSLQHDLKATSDRINIHLEQLGNDIIHRESERHKAELERLYAHAEQEIKNIANSLSENTDQHKQKLETFSQQTDIAIKDANQNIENYKLQLGSKLEELYQQAETSIATINQDVESHAQQVKQQISKQAEDEKQQLIDQFETKLADAALAFLTETLGHNVDLGAQSEYLTKTLESHKDELIKGIKDEA